MAGQGSESNRVSSPELPEGRIPLQAPPDQVEAGGVGNILATVIPMMGSMGVMVFMAMSQGSNPRMLLMAGAMVIAMLSMVAFNIYRQIGGHRQKVNAARREYLAYLTEMRQTVRTAARKQRQYTAWHLPDPDSLVLIAQDGSRLWEREPGDSDTLTVRLGTSTQDLSMELDEPDLPPLANPDVVCHSAMSRFVAAHSTVDDMPFGVMLGEFSHVEIAGDPAFTRPQARAMITHLATFVPPTALKIAVLTSQASIDQWEWLKWLPHARSGEVADALGPSRMIVTSPADLGDLLGEDVTTRSAFQPRDEVTAWPHILIIVDDAALIANTRLGSMEGTTGVTVMTLPRTWGPLISRSTLRLLVHPPSAEGNKPALEVVLLDRHPIVAIAESMEVTQAEAIARRMAPWSEDERPESESPAGKSDPKRSQDLLDLLGLGDVRDFDPDTQWKRREGRDRLRVPFGVTPE